MKNERSLNRPKAYFITFTCYGSHLPGDEGWTSRFENGHGTPSAKSSQRLASFCASLMKNPLYQLDQRRRRVVRAAILEISRRRGWSLHALHVRDVHVHNVVEAEVDPETVLNAFKCRASFRLNRSGLDKTSPRRWTKGGSKRRLWTDEDVNRAVEYVLYEQGEPMETYAALEQERVKSKG
jgi:REP element-mobilizing transposase RayT